MIRGGVDELLGRRRYGPPVTDSRQREEFRFDETGTVVTVVLAQEAITVLEVDLQPGAGSGPHRHTKENETIVVLEGELVVSGDRLEQGQAVHLPKGIAHEFRNDGDTVAKALFICVPGGLERFFRALAARDSHAAAAAGVEPA